jgi:DNA invertase Pin-like site-specific DNA recombinase
VIDDDLGKSGSSAVGRAGFQRLVTEISLGHVGLVLGTEMSRLARSGKDWYQLIELCALSGALLADVDGVYDPAQYNDRLLLGLKGTMSEAELHLIKQRMQAGRINKARRGEMAITLPTGYWRRPSGEAMLDPDEQVQAVVRLIFAKFAEIGTIQGTMRHLIEQGIEIGIRMRYGPDKGEVVWKRPARATITCMLHSPIYAGIYVYGRRRLDPLRQRPGHPKAGRRNQGEDDWLAYIEGALPAYISIEQYRANKARLTANAPHADTPGAVRYGPALLAGLLRCGRCRRRMTVTYHVDDGTPRTSYDCTGARAEYGGPACQHLSGRCLDEFVAQQVLAALAPAAAEVSLRAAEQALTDRAAIDKIWRLRLERAQTDVDRAGAATDWPNPKTGS